MTLNPKDFEGNKYGKLTVLKLLKPGLERKCICKCDCGSKFKTSLKNIRRGRTKSCGCLTECKRLENGSVFGNYTVIGRENINRRYFYICRCICGTENKILGKDLKSGNSKGCNNCVKLHFKHQGKSISNIREYNSWKSMKRRCYNKNNSNYKNYGALGVKVCKRWKNKESGFLNFLEDMGERPNNKTIDRINTYGNYTPKNCRWATARKQSNNRKDNVFINYKGKRITLANAARKEEKITGRTFQKLYCNALDNISKGIKDSKVFTKIYNIFT